MALFSFNTEWHAILLGFPAEVRTEVYDGIIGYAESGTLPELKPLAKMAAMFIIKDMDYINKRYGELSGKRRAAANARWSKEQNDANSSKNMQNDANSSKNMQNDANSSKNMQNDANSSKNMQPMLNMNMNMNNIESINTLSCAHERASEREGEKVFGECCTRFLGEAERAYRERIAMKYGITDFAGAFSEFKGILIERGLLQDVKTSRDFKRMFVYFYCEKNNQKAKKNETHDNREEVRRYVAERLAMGDSSEPDISEDY